MCGKRVGHKDLGDWARRDDGCVHRENRRDCQQVTGDVGEIYETFSDIFALAGECCVAPRDCCFILSCVDDDDDHKNVC